eukprot:SAG11_NODE_8736_length_981_cov_1.285714_1_plen_241_part_10
MGASDHATRSSSAASPIRRRLDALRESSGLTTSAGSTTFIATRDAELRAAKDRFEARFAEMHALMADQAARSRALEDELRRERDMRVELERAVAADRATFGARLQQQLLDVDLVLPSAASAKLLKKARAFDIPDAVREDLLEYGIIPEGGFDFVAERCLPLLLHPDELGKVKLRIPTAAGLSDPSVCDQPVHDAMSEPARKQFNRARNEQEGLLSRYSDLLAVSNILCDESIEDVDERLDL